jgi:hypothetical protein
MAAAIRALFGQPCMPLLRHDIYYEPGCNTPPLAAGRFIEIDDAYVLKIFSALSWVLFNAYRTNCHFMAPGISVLTAAINSKPILTKGIGQTKNTFAPTKGRRR